MTKLVVDTNIVFSAILNIASNIASILISKSDNYGFYSCYFLKQELLIHKKKILKITGYSEMEFLEIEYLITKNIQFIHHETIPSKTNERAKLLCEKIDIKDSPFVALALYLKSSLWSGDKKLIEGLKNNGFTDTISTKELFNL